MHQGPHGDEAAKLVHHKHAPFQHHKKICDIFFPGPRRDHVTCLARWQAGPEEPGTVFSPSVQRNWVTLARLTLGFQVQEVSR